MKLLDLLEEFLARQRLQGNGASNLRRTRVVLAEFLAQVPESPHELRAAHLLEFRRALENGPLAPTTIFQRFAVVRQFVDWAARSEYLLFHPGEEFKGRSPLGRRRHVPTVEEMDRMLMAPDPQSVAGQRDRVLLETLYGTGVRNAELSALQLQDLERQPPGLWVRQGKGSKDRFIPIGDHLAGVLERYLLDVRPALRPTPGLNVLFLNDSGRRLTHKNVCLLRRYSPGPVVTPHCIRHAYATHLLQGGATLAEVRILLGHSDLQSTEVYTRVFPADLVRVYRRTHPRARRRNA